MSSIDKHDIYYIAFLLLSKLAFLSLSKQLFCHNIFK